MRRLRLLSVTSEIYPLVKTGGLADVAGALPAALASQNIEVRTLIPGYPAVMAAIEGVQRLCRIDDLMGGRASLLRASAGGLDLLVLDAPHLYDRPGNPYVDASGQDWPDNGQRFAALARMAADIGTGLLGAYRPSLIHAHDWQAGLVPAYLHYSRKAAPPVVLTVHNLAFQGRFPARMLAMLGLPPSSFTIDGVEYHGDIGFLKAGLRFADHITTVSPSYAAEIATEDGGMGLGGLIRGRADHVTGILNGIDTSVWDPGADPLIARRYTAATLRQRAANKAELQSSFDLEINRDRLLFGVVSRLTDQKGLDLLLAALPVLLAEGAQLALLGTGDALLEARFLKAAAAHPGQIACLIGYDEYRAHLMQAGSDAILVPSRFEPCGLTQLCALRYGALPVVARTGGLADTVIDANPAALMRGVATGVQFAPVNEAMLENALRRTASLYRQPQAWRAIQTNGMSSDVSWTASAMQYAALYRTVCARQANALRNASAKA